MVFTLHGDGTFIGIDSTNTTLNSGRIQINLIGADTETACADQFIGSG